MIKYTRSVQKVNECIEDIFAAPEPALDTKAIVLVLAATLPHDKFCNLIDPVAKLNAINAKAKEINDLRIKGGDLFRDFIILKTLQYLPRDITSDELQQFIKDSVVQPQTSELQSALNSEQLAQALDQQPDRKDLSSAIESTTNYLLERIENLDHSKLQIITDAYLQCRNQEQPVAAYYALIYSLAGIFEAGGLDAHNSLLYGTKLAQAALTDFVQVGKKPKLILNTHHS